MKLQSKVLIDAPVSAVWDVLTDPEYVPRLYPDAISIEANPPGRSAIGQEYRIVGKVGRRRLLILTRLTELVPEKRIVTSNKPGGLFRSFMQTIDVTSKGGKTEVDLTYEYEIAAGYIGKILNEILLARLVKDNISGYGKNLKQLCELIPITG